MELSPFQNIHSHKHLVPQPISTLFQLFQALVSLTSLCLSRLQPPFLLILSQVRIKLSYLILSYLILSYLVLSYLILSYQSSYSSRHL